ncbi:dihydrolipoyllysine-residue acetyltransferase [Pleionea sediminis]|uniref:dihydrolipoyllysine-residue acetyltransferase n=1 Tax=Pleionea sediminis TaxID=2569479 RepID=UPI0011870205|nr:dihydrolipoyllysine-residue acetyltransferase [Pleionea sediminis]
MTKLVEVKIPDIGDASKVDVIEVLVSEGDKIEKEDSLITLETDKATMDVPASDAGIVKELKVSTGDKVSKGDVILVVEVSDNESAGDDSSKSEPSKNESVKESSESDDAAGEKESSDSEKEASSQNSSSGGTEKEVTVPDIGDAADVDVIEVCVSKGDSVDENDSLIVLETDKATVEVPSPFSGKISDIKVATGDKVSKGSLIAMMQVEDSNNKDEEKDTSSSNGQKSDSSNIDDNSSASDASAASKKAPVPDYPQHARTRKEGLVHASPAVRRFARELGVELGKVNGTGNKNRVTKDDVQKYVKFELSRPKATAATGSSVMPEMPEIDFSKWGEIETKPLSRIQKISSVNLHRNWVTIPHVTQHEDADITELEEFRKSMKEDAAKQGVRLTPLAFVMKALVHTLKAFPRFNASLANDGENLILKKYFHIGVAADTPEGLVVPVVRDVDQKSIYQIANELADLSAKARDKKLGADAMQGSTFTISSLGGIGGTSFTPIVAWPNVAILGLSRNQTKPIWNGSEFEPRLMLPMSLSYDHRVIDGADAARFCVHLAETLKDIRRVLL